MITVDQLKAKIKRDLTNYVPSGAPVPSNVKENMLLILEVLGGGGGGGGSSLPVSNTYAELKAMIAAGTLVPGQRYLFSDFQTVHYITDGNSNQDLTSIITGPVEPMIVTAISPTQFHSQAISLLYPQDDINIDFEPMNWINDLSFADQNLGPAPEIIVPGWKGTISFRHDRLNDISMGFDWKHCKFRRWKYAYATYDPLNATYGYGSAVIDGTTVWVAFAQTTVPAGTLGQPDYWMKTVDLQYTPYMNSRPNGADFVDVTVFGQAPGIVEDYSLNVRNFHVLPTKDNIQYWNSSGTALMNNVFWLCRQGYYNYIGLKFGSDSGQNTFACTDCSDFIAGEYFYGNVITGGAIRSNTFGNNFQSNTMMNPARNNILADAINCKFGDQFDGNSVLGKLNAVTFGALVKGNIFKGQVSSGSINQSATACEFSFMNTPIIGYNLRNSKFSGEFYSLRICNDCGQLNMSAGSSAFFIEQPVNRLTVLGDSSGITLNATTAPRIFGAAQSADKTILVNAVTTPCLQYVDNLNAVIAVPLGTP